MTGPLLRVDGMSASPDGACPGPRTATWWPETLHGKARLSGATIGEHVNKRLAERPSTSCRSTNMTLAYNV